MQPCRQLGHIFSKIIGSRHSWVTDGPLSFDEPNLWSKQFKQLVFKQKREWRRFTLPLSFLFSSFQRRDGQIGKIRLCLWIHWGLPEVQKPSKGCVLCIGMPLPLVALLSTPSHQPYIASYTLTEFRFTIHNCKSFLIQLNHITQILHNSCPLCSCTLV